MRYHVQRGNELNKKNRLREPLKTTSKVIFSISQVFSKYFSDFKTLYVLKILPHITTKCTIWSKTSIVLLLFTSLSLFVV